MRVFNGCKSQKYKKSTGNTLGKHSEPSEPKRAKVKEWNEKIQYKTVNAKPWGICSCNKRVNVYEQELHLPGGGGVQYPLRDEGGLRRLTSILSVTTSRCNNLEPKREFCTFLGKQYFTVPRNSTVDRRKKKALSWHVQQGPNSLKGK